MEIEEWEIRREQEKKRESIMAGVEARVRKTERILGEKVLQGRRGKGKWQNDKKKKKTGDTEARGDVIR